MHNYRKFSTAIHSSLLRRHRLETILRVSASTNKKLQQ
jgi:hypothetical protein